MRGPPLRYGRRKEAATEASEQAVASSRAGKLAGGGAAVERVEQPVFEQVDKFRVEVGRSPWVRSSLAPALGSRPLDYRGRVREEQRRQGPRVRSSSATGLGPPPLGQSDGDHPEPGGSGMAFEASTIHRAKWRSKGTRYGVASGRSGQGLRS